MQETWIFEKQSLFYSHLIWSRKGNKYINLGYGIRTVFKYCFIKVFLFLGNNVSLKYVFIHCIRFSGRWLLSAVPLQERTILWIKEKPEECGMSSQVDGLSKWRIVKSCQQNRHRKITAMSVTGEEWTGFRSNIICESMTEEGQLKKDILMKIHNKTLGPQF